MPRRTLCHAVIAVLALTQCSPATAEARLRFWNLTAATITELYVAPSGTDRWSRNQCENDPDKSVDADERLPLADIEPGRYDVKLTDKSGRRCLVHNIEVKSDGRYAFSISESDLTDCQR